MSPMKHALHRAVRERSSSSKLAFFHFVDGFAVHALTCGWSGFESSNADLHSAGFAVAILSLIESVNRGVDLSYEFALAIPGTQLKAELFLLSGSVRRVRELVGATLHVIHRSIHLFHELLPPRQEDVSKVLQLLCAHIGFALLLLVGLKGLEARIHSGLLNHRVHTSGSWTSLSDWSCSQTNRGCKVPELGEFGYTFNLRVNPSTKICIVCRVLKTRPVEAHDMGGGQVSEVGHLLRLGAS